MNSLLFCLSVLGWVSPEAPKEFWRDQTYILDRHELLHHIELSSETEQALIGDISQILLYRDEILIVDSNQTRQIKRFDLQGSFLGLIGGIGEGPGEFIRPFQLATDHRASLLIYDLLSPRLTLFDHSLAYSHRISVKAKGSDRFVFPRGVARHERGWCVAVDEGGGLDETLVIMDDQGKVLKQLPGIREPNRGKLNHRFIFSLSGGKAFIAAKTEAAFWIWDPDSDELKKIPVRGYPNLLQADKFDFEHRTYDKTSDMNLLDYRINRVHGIFPLGDRLMAVGPLNKAFVSLSEPKSSLPKTEEGWKERDRRFGSYYDLFDLDGNLVRHAIRLAPNPYPKEDPMELAHADGTHLYFYRWRDHIDENPEIFIYRGIWSEKAGHP